MERKEKNLKTKLEAFSSKTSEIQAFPLIEFAITQNTKNMSNLIF